ncbi:nucleotide-sugar epimerase [Baekduia alba]|uniref:NAD(P)H-binding protein n=1 Tax=Baekduia alba TaxID=2997333 RepID=UPI00234252ED|nr:NAD(P)H-binding protein [Baekduia alba]WCB93477.1 nucleotide-sugar epimerase [Baekduia alba]
MTPSHLTLITGAAGFVGRHLIGALRDDRPLRALVRAHEDLDADAGVEVVTGDLADRDGLAALLDGVDCVYYLVHSMEAGGDDDFAARDRELAHNMADAARVGGVRRLVYLGGVDPQGGDSEHLDSRHEVEDILRGYGGELVALRAAMIVGRGSASFDTLAQIVDRLPILALPTWRDRLCQPVAIDDVVAALAAAADVAPGRYDIAGPDRLTFKAMVEQIAELQGGSASTFDLPFSNSRLEGAAAALVTDQDRALLTPLMAGLDADLVVDDNALIDVFGVTPTPFVVAARAALADVAVP